jgi:hypothetical protein
MTAIISRAGATTTDPRTSLISATVGLVWASALIHAIVVPEHLHEWGPAGAFFITTAATQLAAAALLWRNPTRALLRLIAYGSGALVLLWTISRTVGIPLGPHAGEVEPVGAVDMLSTLDELGAIALAALLLSGRVLLTRLAATLASGLVALSLLATMIGSAHQHQHARVDELHQMP